MVVLDIAIVNIALPSIGRVLPAGAETGSYLRGHARAGSPPLEGARRALRRLLHGRARHRDREHRAAVDRAGARVLAREPPVGDHLVLAHVRGLPAARRA